MSNIAITDPSKYSVNRPGQETLVASLYDFQTYASAGQTSLTFFQIPIGQSGKTLQDTNMDLAGQLPAGKRFLVTGIQILFFSGAAIDTFNVAAAASPGQADDNYAFHKSGWLNWNIGSKSYLTEAPLGRFPAKTGLRVDVAQATNSATVGNVKSEYSVMSGAAYNLQVPIYLEPTQNFNFSMNWPVAVALPSGQNARVGIVLNGLLYRNSQ